MNEPWGMSYEMNNDLYDDAQSNDGLYVDSTPHDGSTAVVVEGEENETDIIDSHDKKETVKIKNDLQDSVPTLGSDMFAEMAKISNHKFERAKARQWATRDICFLVYDDADVQKNGFDSDGQETQQEYALQMSLGDGNTLAAERADKTPRSEFDCEAWKSGCRVCA